VEKEMLTSKAFRTACAGLAVAAVGSLAAVAPAYAHHSFASYDMTATKVFTGVVTRVNPDANHLQIFFAPMNDERKNVMRDAKGDPVVWAVEMQGSAQMAEQGVSVNTFPPGTVFSVALHPLRSGDSAGSKEGALVKCPTHAVPGSERPKSIPPEPGKHCDTVEGATFLSGDKLAPPSVGAAQTATNG
jgi:hypothetical protein